MVNPAMFKEAGLTYPPQWTSMQDLLADAQKLAVGRRPDDPLRLPLHLPVTVSPSSSWPASCSAAASSGSRTAAA